jgi:hypothetical protein
LRAWLAQVSFTRDSWTAPLDVRRVAPTDDAHRVAAAPIRALLPPSSVANTVPRCLPRRWARCGFLAWDGGTDEFVGVLGGDSSFARRA